MSKETKNIPEIKAYFDAPTNTVSYLVTDPATKKCAVVDSVLNFEYSSGTISYAQADEIIGDITDQGLTLDWLIETHVHADHLSAAPYIQEKLGGKIMISKEITVVQNIFGKVFNAGTEFERDGSQFDMLLSDGDTYQVGSIDAKVLHTPGHTPACMAHVIGDVVFVGDTLFMPDGGSARADFPGGDARTLYQSIQKIFTLPDDTRMFICHDYMPGGRDVKWETTVGEQKRDNIHVGKGNSEDDFVAMREARDATLGMPTLIMPSIQVNMRAGHMPQAEDNGSTYLKVPVSGIRDSGNNS
jgi:glyoxylase-like metal-dependent hydrolase (beta-lactamase superfamily II)